MELIAFFFGLIGILYGIWALISPFIVIGLTNRVTQLEGQLEKLKKRQIEQLRKVERDASATVAPVATPPIPDPVSSPILRDDRDYRAAVHVEPSAPAPILESATPPLPVPEISTKPTGISDIESERQTAEEKAGEYVRQVEHNTPSTDSSEIPAAVTPYALRQPDNTAAPAAAPVAPVVKPSAVTPSPADRDEPSTLEEILAGKWLTWVGALAVIIGAGFGFKYAIENNWVGARERVLIGIVTGLLCFAGGAYAIRRNYVFLAQGLTGSALGILYLSLYAAFGWYGILSYEAAFVGMILTTTLGLSFAGYFNVQPTAVLGMIGGFLTPAMLWPDHDPMWTLFPYLLMLDLGVLLIAGVRRWAGLEVLAFCGTIMIWLGWHRQFYLEEYLAQTSGFMTAFLVLFALLSVWHNVIRKRTANAGDFFLILATPTVYFAALYALTFERLPHWQGEFSLSMMLFYAMLAALAAVWHPAGRSVIAALVGLAATFLILAVPLELTGHWVAICWIAQAVLLVELGLYFREKTLAWTGLALLVKVQGILLIYFLGTLIDPVHFQTAFVRIQLHLIGRPVTPIDAADSWMSLINGRSLSYLADVIGFAILAWEFGRRRKETAALDAILPQRGAFELWLNVTVPVVALTMIVLETFVWGVMWHWDMATIVSAWTIWTACFACGLILWSQLFRSRGIELLGWLFFALLACFACFETIEALEVALRGAQMPPHRLEAWWLLNPRGIGLLMTIVATAVVSFIYAAFPGNDTATDLPTAKYTPRQLKELFGTLAYALALGLVLLETRVWGAGHQWLASTNLSACAIWTTVFLLAAVAWRLLRKAPWVESLIRATLLLLQFWLVMNAIGTVVTIVTAPLQDMSGVIAQWWLLNPRGIGFLISALGCAVAGLALSRNIVRGNQTNQKSIELSRWIGVAAYTIGLVMVTLETSLWGVTHAWRIPTLFSTSAMWVTAFLVGATLWRVLRRENWMDGVVLTTFWLLEALLAVNVLVSVQSVQSAAATDLAATDWWFLNPRCIGFLLSIIAAGISAYFYRGLQRTIRISAPSHGNPGRTLDVSHLFAIAVYLTGLVMFTLEVYVQGTSRDWHTATSLAITLVWTAYATLTLIAGIYCRSGWVRVFSLAVFVLTVGKVFLLDVWHLDTVIRVFAFISLGVALLLVSFLYRRFRDRIRSWMAPELNAGRLETIPKGA